MITNLARDVRAFTSNVFLVTGERTVLVDVGNDFDAVAAVREAGADVDAVVLTHTHPDHVGTLGAVSEAWPDAPVIAFDGNAAGVDRALGDGESVRMGDHEYRALHTPGHKDDHLCLYAHETGVLFAGDLVFANGSFGRTDLEEGDRATLIRSIEYVLETVDEDLDAMYTGHGPAVTSTPYHDVELALQAARTGA